MDDETTKGWDLNRIDMDDEDEVDYWSKIFGVTKAELLATVERVGDYVDAVAEELETGRRKRAA